MIPLRDLDALAFILAQVRIWSTASRTDCPCRTAVVVMLMSSIKALRRGRLTPFLRMYLGTLIESRNSRKMLKEARKMITEIVQPANMPRSTLTQCD